MNSKNLIEIKNLEFYWNNQDEFKIQINDFSIQTNEKKLILGKSGIGKSTFLNLICGMISARAGDIYILSQNLSSLKAWELDKFRSENIGVIFQEFNLLDHLSPLNNILLPCYFTNKDLNKSKERAYLFGKKLNLNNDLLTKSNSKDLSTGQKQRISIIRSIINKPKIILADEPTSSLDFDNKNSFLNLLFNICNAEKISLLMVSHDLNLKNKFKDVTKFESFFKL